MLKVEYAACASSCACSTRKLSTRGTSGSLLDPVRQRARRAHQLQQAVPGDVADVPQRQLLFQQRRDQPHVHHRRLQQRLAQRRCRPPARSRSHPAVAPPAVAPARRRWRAARWRRPARSHRPGASSSPRSGRRPAGTTPTAAPASSISRSSSSPGSDGDSPPPHVQPASTQALRQPSISAAGALALAVPLRGAGREVRVHDQRQRARRSRGRCRSPRPCRRRHRRSG